MSNPFEPIELKLIAIEESLRDLNKKLDQPQQLKLYSRKEAAQLLHMTLPTLYSYTTKGLIKMSKVGRRCLYTEEAIRKALVEIQGGGRWDDDKIE